MQRSNLKKMKYIKNILFVLSILISKVGTGQDIPANYLILAAEHNNALKAGFSTYMASLEKVPQAGTLPDPQLTFGYFIQPVETRNGPQVARIGLTQMFPWFGTLNSHKDVYTENAKATYELFLETKSNLFYEIRSEWYTLCFLNKSIRITGENIELLKTLREIVLSKIETGNQSVVEALKIEMDLKDLEYQQELLKDNLETRKTVFRTLVNADDILIDLPDTVYAVFPELTKEQLWDSLRVRNHHIRNLEYQEASYNSKIISARKAGSPSLSVGFEYIVTGQPSGDMASNNDSGKDAVLLPKVGVSLPLYRKKYKAMQKEAGYMTEATAFTKESALDKLESLYENVYTDLLDAERRSALHSGQLDLALKARNIMETEFATDKRGLDELLEMERQVLKHSLEQVKAVTDQNTAVAYLNYLMGN